MKYQEAAKNDFIDLDERNPNEKRKDDWEEEFDIEEEEERFSGGDD